MSQTIADMTRRDRRGFTLAEVLIAIIVGTFVMISAWSAYMMVWQWWSEMGPRLDVERSARLALLNTIEGVTSVSGLSGDVAGSYTVNSVAHKRRNGIAWANKDPGDNAYPEILDQTGYPASRIRYHLVPDGNNVKREIYFGTYNGQGVLYYKHTSGASYRLDSTLGITNLKFEKLSGTNNIIKVTVTSQKQVYGTRTQQPYTVQVVYTDTVFLRNAL